MKWLWRFMTRLYWCGRMILWVHNNAVEHQIMSVPFLETIWVTHQIFKEKWLLHLGWNNIQMSWDNNFHHIVGEVGQLVILLSYCYQDTRLNKIEMFSYMLRQQYNPTNAAAPFKMCLFCFWFFLNTRCTHLIVWTRIL